jgi:hypothetical protein
LRITDAAAETLIRRIHFKNDRSYEGFGGAVYTMGILTLESCIFSGNRVDDFGLGGAVYSENTLTIRGCTFYGNSAPQATSDALFFYASGKTLTLTGNLFYGNGTSQSVHNSESSGLGLVSASYNVVDRAFGTAFNNDLAGWDRGQGTRPLRS